jgi:hypothetical protein
MLNWVDLMIPGGNISSILTRETIAFSVSWDGMYVMHNNVITDYQSEINDKLSEVDDIQLRVNSFTTIVSLSTIAMILVSYFTSSISDKKKDITLDQIRKDINKSAEPIQDPPIERKIIFGLVVLLFLFVVSGMQLVGF